MKYKLLKNKLLIYPFLLGLLLLGAGSKSQAQTPDWQWAKQLSTLYGAKVGADGNENLYLQFGDSIVKYDSKGNLLKKLIVPTSGAFSAFAVDSAGNIVTANYCTNPTSIKIEKYNAQGNLT